MRRGVPPQAPRVSCVRSPRGVTPLLGTQGYLDPPHSSLFFFPRNGEVCCFPTRPPFNPIGFLPSPVAPNRLFLLDISFFTPFLLFVLVSSFFFPPDPPAAWLWVFCGPSLLLFPCWRLPGLSSGFLQVADAWSPPCSFFRLGVPRRLGFRPLFSLCFWPTDCAGLRRNLTCPLRVILNPPLAFFCFPLTKRLCPFGWSRVAAFSLSHSCSRIKGP